MTKIRLLAVLGATGGLVTAALLAVPGPAQAGNDNYCPWTIEKVCIYANNNWVGLLDSPRWPDGGIRNVPARDDDKMDSWENDTRTNASWYHDANGRGDCVTMSAGYEDDNINVFDSDELSSWRTDRGC